jgi:hypothetical protein
MFGGNSSGLAVLGGKKQVIFGRPIHGRFKRIGWLRDWLGLRWPGQVGVSRLRLIYGWRRLAGTGIVSLGTQLLNFILILDCAHQLAQPFTRLSRNFFRSGDVFLIMWIVTHIRILAQFAGQSLPGLPEFLWKAGRLRQLSKKIQGLSI